MNPHFHPYSEISSPHPPSPDNNNYHNHPGLPSQHLANITTNGHGSNHHLAGNQGHEQNHHHFVGGPNNGPNSLPPGSMMGHHGMNHNNNNPPMKHCAGCGGKIVERFLLHALDRYWHNACLKCSCCGTMLAEIGSSCFTKGGMILCKNDYMRMFGGSGGACSACGQNIPASEFVMRTGPGLGGPGGGGGANNAPGGPGGATQQHHVFHLKCFACSKCGAHLVPGDRYYMLAGSLVCEQDWNKLLKSSAASGTGPTVRKGKVGRPRRSRD